MIKSVIIFIFSTFLISIYSFGQFSFKDDNTDMRVQSGAIQEIDKKFKLEKENDFELRLFVFPKWSDNEKELMIFILSFKNEKWQARLFRNAWSPKDSKESPLKNERIDSLWAALNENDVLTIPLSQTLVDKKGEMIIEQLQSNNNSLSYTFELLSKTAYRSYGYKCPAEFAKKYDYVPTFKKVANIIQLIFQFCGLSAKFICSANESTICDLKQAWFA